jgi:hypothetical protein
MVGRPQQCSREQLSVWRHCGSQLGPPLGELAAEREPDAADPLPRLDQVAAGESSGLE